MRGTLPRPVLNRRTLGLALSSNLSTLYPAVTFRLAFLCFALMFVLASIAQTPRLEILGRQQNGDLQLRLHGETNGHYLIETSTNLIAWESLASAQLTNGLADLTYSTTAAHHSFLRARSEQNVTLPAVTAVTDPTLDVTSVIRPDGGRMTLFTRDLRRITIEFPPGCFLHPTEVRASSVTNLVGLPFARGALGAVQLEPEGLGLFDAATISIDYPPGIDSRSVVSFSANNDGTALRLALDRPLSNNVVIPISTLGLYGSSTGTLAEVQSLTLPRSELSAQTFVIMDPIADEQCRLFYPERFRADFSQFPQTTSECFKELGDRAIEVQLALRAFLDCEVGWALSDIMAIVRSRELLGAITPEESGQIRENILRARLCPIYQEKIAPFWQEAKGNCALGIVLMQTMLSFERQVQRAGLTNAAPCNYTLSRNMEAVCKIAETCLTEIRACCALGHKGQQKYAEIVQLVNKFELFTGDLCLPGGMNNPTVDGTVTECLSNAWYGTFTVRHFGTYAKTETIPGGTTTEIEDIDFKYEGEIFETISSTLPGLGVNASLRTHGHAFVDLEHMIITSLSTACGGAERTVRRTKTDGRTNGTSNPFGQYGVGIFISAAQPDKYQITASAGALISTHEVNGGHIWSRNCDGGETNETLEQSESNPSAGYPLLPPTFFDLGDNTNKITGVHRIIDNNGKFPVTTEFHWNFTRHREGAPQ